MATQTSISNTHSTSADNNTPVSPLKQVLNQAKFELLLTARRGENILITLIVPVMLLIFFTSFNIIPTSHGQKEVDLLLPGILALAIIAAGLVNLGIATAYDRNYGVLKRLGSSPLSRGGLIIAKIISILVLELVQVILLLGIAAALYGWRPAGSPLFALLAIILGTITFAALGLAMAGGLRAEMTLAGANALYLLFLFISGGILPLNRFPAPIATLASLLPSSALTQALQTSMTSNTFPTTALLVLVVWAVIILLIAARTFKWE